jgi:hypothetical protein
MLTPQAIDLTIYQGTSGPAPPLLSATLTAPWPRLWTSKAKRGTSPTRRKKFQAWSKKTRSSLAEGARRNGAEIMEPGKLPVQVAD